MSYPEHYIRHSVSEDDVNDSDSDDDPLLTPTLGIAHRTVKIDAPPETKNNTRRKGSPNFVPRRSLAVDPTANAPLRRVQKRNVSQASSSWGRSTTTTSERHASSSEIGKNETGNSRCLGSESVTEEQDVACSDSEDECQQQQGSHTRCDFLAVKESEGNSGAASVSSSGTGSVLCRPHFVVDKRNEKAGRGLKVTQRECVSGGTKEIQTKVDVYDLTYPDCPVIFSVKHLHSGVWGRQTIVHKNLLLACALAEINSPLEIPVESRRAFEQGEQDHLHTYLERVTPFIKYNKIPSGVSLYWWRVVGNGAVVLQNSKTGKMMFFPNKARTVPTAVETLAEVIRNIPLLPASFFLMNPSYPAGLTDLDIEKIGNPDEILSPSDVRDVVLEDWTLDDGIGPWTTSLVLQIEGQRRRLVNIRYSIGVDEKDLNVLAIQVHRNEPLVQDLKAFPVCVLQMAPRNNTRGEVYLAYKRARFFLQKLFKFHVAPEGGNSLTGAPHMREGCVSGTPLPQRKSRAQSARMPMRSSVNLNNILERQDSRNLSRNTPRIGQTTPRLGLNTPSLRQVSSVSSAVGSKQPTLGPCQRGSSGGSLPLSPPRAQGAVGATRTSGVMTPAKSRIGVGRDISPSRTSRLNESGKLSAALQLSMTPRRVAEMQSRGLTLHTDLAVRPVEVRAVSSVGRSQGGGGVRDATFVSPLSRNSFVDRNRTFVDPTVQTIAK